MKSSCLIALRALAIILALVGTAVSAQAQTVPVSQASGVAPQIEILGSGTATADLGLARRSLDSGGQSPSSRIDLSDSSLVVGASERLYSPGAVGSFVAGCEAADQEDTSGTNGLFLHQLYADYQDRKVEAKLGRTNSATQYIDFPTLRGADLIGFTNIPDPYSNGVNADEARYADVANLTYTANLRDFVDIHAQSPIDSASDADSSFGLVSYGAALYHLPPPGLEGIQNIVSYDAGYEFQKIARVAGGSSNFVYGGGVVNVLPGSVNRVTLSLQDIFSSGNSTPAFTDITDTYRASGNAVAASLAYLHSPFGMPSSQIALTAGYKSYDKVRSASSYGLALSGVKRIGAGFDVVAQYFLVHRDQALAAVAGGSEDHGIQVGFTFNFDAIFNDTVGARRSLLNLQHQYIPER